MRCHRSSPLNGVGDAWHRTPGQSGAVTAAICQLPLTLPTKNPNDLQGAVNYVERASKYFRYKANMHDVCLERVAVRSADLASGNQPSKNKQRQLEFTRPLVHHFLPFLRISKLPREQRLGLRGGRVGEGRGDGNLASEWPRYLIDGLFKQTATHTSPCGTVPQRPRLKHGAWTQDKHKGDPRGESDRQGNTFLYHISKPRHLFLHPTPRSEKSR